VVSYAHLKPMLKTLQQVYESRGVVAPLVAILVVSAILLVVVFPIFDAGFDHLTSCLPVVVFFLLAPAEVASYAVLSVNNFTPTEPFLAASPSRAPPA
jgi:hypothetical protein